MSAFAVFGNPIKHSKSAEIYSLFAQEVGISREYALMLASQDNFDYLLCNFFKSGGMGANITSPFKERAFFLCDQLTERAKLTHSVNTIKKQNDDTLLGDNTDGIGFVSDLKRLNWIVSDDNLSTTIDKNMNILLVGAGGSAKGIIPALLTTVSQCHINIANKTFYRAQSLASLYNRMGYRNISCTSLGELFDDTDKYDLVINATTSSMFNTIPNISSHLITSSTKCYDLFYQKQSTSFIRWCKQNGSLCCSDGLGMLVEQAAHAFFLWHNIFPSVSIALNHVRSTLNM